MDMISIQLDKAQDVVANPLWGTRCVINGSDYGEYTEHLKYKGLRVGSHYTYDINKGYKYKIIGFADWKDVDEFVVISEGPYGLGWDHISYVTSERCIILD